MAGAVASGLMSWHLARKGGEPPVGQGVGDGLGRGAQEWRALVAADHQRRDCDRGDQPGWQ